MDEPSFDPIEQKAAQSFNDADHLARMVCKLLRPTLNGEFPTLSPTEARRLYKWAQDWLTRHTR